MESMILTHTLKGRIWFMCPITLISKTTNYIAFRISVGSPVYRAVSSNGKNASLDATHWYLKKGDWKNNNLTYLVPYDEYVGYGVITDCHNNIGYYYLNFQDLIQVSKNVVNTLDFELDLVITDYEKQKYFWKDADQFHYLRSKHIFNSAAMENLKLDERELLESFEKYKADLDTFGTMNVESPSIEEFQKHIPFDLYKEFIE